MREVWSEITLYLSGPPVACVSVSGGLLNELPIVDPILLYGMMVV
jgi:hypothetical protein